MDEPKPGEIYEHFKGGDYEVLDIARDCENPSKKVVVYKSLYEHEEYPRGTVWTRSLDDFVSEKEIERDMEIYGKIFKKGDRVKRFSLKE